MDLMLWGGEAGRAPFFLSLLAGLERVVESSL